MSILEIFDRPLCCSTGICGPQVDPVLVHFAADLDWLRSQGIEVHRYNLAFEPASFLMHTDVKEALQVGQVGCLPLVRVNGRIVSQAQYPDREALASWFCLEAAQRTDQAGNACSAPSCCS
jgi:hypothetical protein